MALRCRAIGEYAVTNGAVSDSAAATALVSNFLAALEALDLTLFTALRNGSPADPEATRNQLATAMSSLDV